MKKRTLVCFLIFTLCVFYTAIPNTVFGQEEGIALAKKVFEDPESKKTLLDEDVRTLLPQLLGGLGSSPIPIPTLITTALNMINNGQEEALKGLAAAQGITLTDDHITLLKREDVQTLLAHEDTVALLSLQGAELEAGLAEVVRLVDEAVAEMTDDDTTDDGTTDDGTTDDGTTDDGTTDDGTTDDGTTDDGTTDDGTTDDETTDDGTTDDGTTDDGTTDDGTTDDGTTDDGTTDDGTTDDGTTDDGTTDDGTTDTDDTQVMPPPERPMVPQVDAITPTNLTGESRLGGLSLNPINGRLFVDQIDATAKSRGFSVDPMLVADFLAGFASLNGFFPRNQIRDALLAERISLFKQEPKELDGENFGNAITPNFADFAYTDYTDRRTDKYLTSDSLHLYVRVPTKLGDGGGVNFHLTDTSGNVQTYAADEVMIDEFQADTIPYTFRLEETLAATHLPAWADLENGQLFSSVELRWHEQHDAPIYNEVPMAPVYGEGGRVVWEADLGIPPDRGSTFYYFEVVLAKPLRFTTLDRDAIAELVPTTVTLDQVFAEENIHQIEIDGWAMPDPRNFQVVDRGIIDEMLTSDLLGVFNTILASPEAAPIILKFLAGETPTTNEIQRLASPELIRDVQQILQRKAEDLLSQFEQDHDPMVASVFSVPKVDLEKHSLWVTRIPNLDDDNYNLEAIIENAEGSPLDQIQENFTVDTRAPEATIEMAPGLNATGYWNSEQEIYYATAPEAGTATLSITADPTDPYQIGPANGYLFYQMVGLTADGTPYAGEIDPEKPYRSNTWMPLTVQSTMLTSTVWDAIRGAISAGRLELPSTLESNSILQLALGLDLDTILNLLKTDPTGDIRNAVDGLVKSLEPFTGFDEINDTQYQLIIDALGATVDIIDQLVPVTFDVTKSVMMPIQGDGMPLLTGDYGIRAVGIDTLFNVGAYAVPTHLSVVGFNDPEQMNRASVILASIGDRNGDGLDPQYEHGIIYANTKEGVELTIKIDQHPHDLASIMVEYQDASGWQPIATLSTEELANAQAGSEFTVTWNVPEAVFDAVDADGFGNVMVRAVATNKLTIKDDTQPMEFPIKLDAGIYPPEVLNVKVDDASITMRNPDSDAPQGMVTINATTLAQTGPRTASVRFEAKRENDTEWKTIGTALQGIDTGLVDAVAEAVSIAAEGTDAPINTGNGNLTWSITVDTTTLDDTITKDSPGARDVSMDNNQYTIRALAVSMDGTEWPIDATAAESTMLSVDNIDDVEPLGPTNITAIAKDSVVVEADPDGGYTLRGLVDPHDESVVPQTVTLTIKPEAVRKTYKSVMLVSDPVIDAALVGAPVETSEGSGVFEITVNVGELGIAGNGAYVIHALAYDASPDGPDEMYGNVQTDASPERTIHVKNYERPDPAVFKITKDLGTETNADSEGPQGTFMFTGYTIEQNSPPIMSIRLEAKRANDTQWTTIGTADASTAVEIEDAALPGVLDHLTGIAVEGTEVGNRSVVAIDATYHEWGVSVDTIALGLEDSITKDSPGARDVSMDDNPYTVRAFAVDASGKEWPSDAIEMFSLDNVDDVAPLGPTNVSVTDVMATDNSVFEDAGDGSYTVGGLVDKYDDAVNSPVATFTVEPTAVRKTYASVRFVPGVEGLVITDVTETAEGSGVFTLTVDVGILADMETYLANGTYMFHALAFDEFGNEQEDMSETDGSKISVTVSNTRRPVPQLQAFTVGDPTQTNPDSGAPQGTIALYGYTPEITSAPTTSVMFEVKRKNDTEWTPVGTASESSSVTAADDAKLAAADIAEVADVVGGNVVKSDTYQKWMIEVDTTTLEDSITKDNPGARDHTKDDNMYMVRATASATADGSANLSADGVTAMFSVDNVDDVAPLGPTNVSVTSVDAIDSVFEASEDGSYTVGGLVDKYDEAVPSPVATFTLEPTAERKTYKSVRFVTDIENLVVGEVTETEEGSGVFTVTVDVGTLADMKTYLENGTYMFQALAFDEFGNEQDTKTDESKASVIVENSYRPDPEVLALAVDPESITQTNPDSGAPQGTITIHAYSHEISSPPTTAVRIEVKRPGDAEWIDVGTSTEPMATTEAEVSDATLTDFVGDLANTAVSATAASDTGEATVVEISRTYQMWAIDVDTTALEDTITADSPAARDASKDDNQYMVRAIPIEEADDFADPEASPNATAMFSVDNDDDVAPLGPTNIVAVSDVAGMIAANEDGSYTVGGIVDDTVPSPIAIFTIEQTADPITYEGGSVNLVQTVADGTETTTEGEAGVLDTITIDVGMLENGTYMFHALTVDKFGNIQSNMLTEESPKITVHVLNFRVSDVSDLAVIAVDGTDVPEPPAEPIPLRESVTVSFMVANGSLALEELSGAVNGQSMPNETAEDPENTFSLMVAVGSLVDGVYTPDAVVTKRNGSVAFPITTVNVDNTGPMVTIESPTEDETVDNLPTLRATYHDGAGSGVDGATGSLALARLQPPNEAEIVVDQAELEKDAESLVYTRREPLAGGAYRVTVQVIDNLGNVGEGSAEFAVNGTAPMVAIHSPTPGQTFEHGEPFISGEFSGIGTVEVTTFTINDVDATPEVDGNQFSYTPEEALANGDYKVVVAVTDSDGNMAQTSIVFVVDIPEPPKDTTPPVISSVAPNGLIKGANKEALGDTRASAVVTDEQSAISAVEFHINGVKVPVSQVNIAAGIIEAPIDFVTHGPGLYTVRLKATSEGGTTEHVWTFTFAIDDVRPTITSITPSGTFRGGLPVISASANDESGIAEMTITVMDSEGKEVKGKTEDDSEDTAKGISRLDFNPDAPLDEGVYTIAVRATDTIGNSTTAKGNFTIDFDTAAPIITMASPHQNARFKLKPGEKAPTVSVAYADAESGINVDSITLVIEGVDSDYKATPSGTKITFQAGQKSASQVMHPLLVDTNAKPETWAGEYVVRLEVADNADLEGNVSSKTKGAREANRTVHTFSFFLEAAEGPILAARPLNYPNPFKDNTRISFTLARQATVSIVIYDATLRPVRVLVDNRVFDAGNYTLKETGSDAIGWDGTSSSGEDLARGIYFCQIVVADGFEPEYAILKLALTR